MAARKGVEGWPFVRFNRFASSPTVDVGLCSSHLSLMTILFLGGWFIGHCCHFMTLSLERIRDTEQRMVIDRT